MNYIYNLPYFDETTNPLNAAYVGKLDPINLVEDYYYENGIGPESIKGKNEDRFIKNGLLNGDRKKTDWQSTSWGNGVYRKGYQLSVFDVNGNGMVENPEVTDPANMTKQYIPDELQRHTIIHEMGHGTGVKGHTSDDKCVMYNDSPDWDRAGHFGDTARAQIKIHNKTEF
jgi:hypothetical protein